MKAWGVLVCLAIAGVQVFAEEPLSYPEDVQRQSNTRIVSGWEAEEGQIPWQLSMRMVNPTGGVNSCGGSIIHPEWGMTAAHCTANRVTMVLRAGAVSLWRPELIFETTEYYNHPLYIDQLAAVVQPNDIALLKFPRVIPFSDRVQPIRIQRDVDQNRNYDGIRLEASGWGRTWTNGELPDNLQWVYLRGVSNLVCWFAFGGSSIIVDSTICASGYNITSQSTCQGDSGGPLVELEEDGKYTMVGVTSFVSGAGCHADFPAGFIRPGHYHSWYREVTGLDFDWDYTEPTEAPSIEDSSSSSESSSSSSSSESSSSESSNEESSEPDTEEATVESGSEEETPESESEETPEVESEEATAESESDETPEVESEEATAESESDETLEVESEEATAESESDETPEVESEEATAESESEETPEVESEEATAEAESEEIPEVESEEATAEAESEETPEVESEEATAEAESDEGTPDVETEEYV